MLRATLFRVGRILCAVDVDIDHLGRPLPVFDTHPGQAAQDLPNRVSKGRVPTAARPDLPVAGLTVGEQDQGVVCAGIAIDRDRVEGIGQGLVEHLLERGLAYGCVGAYIAQHGRHVRVNHAGALGHAGDGQNPAVQGHLPGCDLGKGVGRHDAGHGVPETAWRQRRGRGVHTGLHFPPVGQHANHPRG